MKIIITKKQLFDEIQISAALHVATLEIRGRVYGIRYAKGMDEADIFKSLFDESACRIPTEFLPYDQSSDSFI